MTIPNKINYESLTTEVREEVIEAYQSESYLGLFPSVKIPKGISTEKWAQKYMVETKKAGVHARGFNPNHISMDFKGFQITPVTIDQEAVLSEIDQAQFAQTGMFDKIIPEIGRNMAYTANSWLFMHKGGNGEADFTNEYHYILANGDGGNGTANQPLLLHDSTSAGAWATIANAFSDLAKLKGNFIANGGDFSTSMLFIPRSFSPGILKVRSEYENKTIEDYLNMQGYRWMYIEDHFLKTKASNFETLPTLAAGDIVLVDLAEIIIGYQRPERVLGGEGKFPDRNYYIEGELWFAPLMVPFRKDVDGTIKTYKSVARISGINAT